METLQLKLRNPVVDEIENWDDDDFLIEGDDLPLRNSSASATEPHHRRDSLSSHLSLRSERDSIHGDDEKQVYLPADDERSTLNAIAIAASAGIPISNSVPASALTGGTIKKLGGRKVRKALQEDWSDDLMFPEGTTTLRRKPSNGGEFLEFPETISRRVSSALLTPFKPPQGPSGSGQSNPATTTANVLAPPINLERYRDTKEDEDLWDDNSATIKVSKRRQAGKHVLPKVASITPSRKVGEDDFEAGLELPFDGKLQLPPRKDIIVPPETPVNKNDDFDWGEGSLGTRFGGTRRDGRSNRSSSSAFSPSISSSITAESEDEAQLDGLELPHGPLDLKERLRRQCLHRSPEHIIEEEPTATPSAPFQDPDEDNFLSGLDIGDGSAFGTGKFTLHNNVQFKDNRTTGSTRPKTAISLTFTNKPVTHSRLPRPATVHHERSLTQSSLEPVSESGGVIVSRGPRRSQSRMGHMYQSSQSSTGSNTTPLIPSVTSFSANTSPTTPRKREVGPKTSTTSLRQEPTTTHSQLLRLKRSLPAMGVPGSPARSNTVRAHDRPPSRTSAEVRAAASAARPKTPTERVRQSLVERESAAAQARKPFLPAGASSSQTYNVKGKRMLRHHDSDLSLDGRSQSRAVSRSTVRSPSPTKQRDRNLHKMARAGGRQPLSLPKRAKHFSDGRELEAFDDLPTSAKTESEFMKQPKAVNQHPIQSRNKVMQHLLPGRTNSPAPSTPHTPAKLDNLPRFARDTASSRRARETNLAHRVPSSGPLAPLTSQRVAQLSTRNNLHPLHSPQGSIRSKKPPRKPAAQLKPHLIANLNSSKESKSKSRRALLQNFHLFLLSYLTITSAQRHVLQPRHVPMGGQ